MCLAFGNQCPENKPAECLTVSVRPVFRCKHAIKFGAETLFCPLATVV